MAVSQNLQLKEIIYPDSRKDVLNEHNDTELISRYCLEHAGSLSVIGLVREILVSQRGATHLPP